MSNLTSSLTIKLIDDVSKPAKTVAAALKQAETNAKSIAAAMSKAGATDRFVGNLAKLKLSAKDIEAVSKAWRDYSKSAGLAANSALWTKDQVAGVKRWESQTIGALRAVKREQMAFNRSMSAAGGIHPMTAAMSANAIANARLKSMHGPSIATPAAAAIAATARPSRAMKAKQIIAEQASGLGAYAVPAGAGYAAAGFAGTPAAVALGGSALAVKEAISRDAAMADIRKKVDLGRGQSFDDIEAIARRVSRERGMAFGDSAALIAQAGQSGIPGKDLGQFATLSAKVSSAWDISAKEAAQSLAEVRAQTGWTLQQLEQFADRVNKAGDVSAAAEKDIASMWQRSSAGAKSAGVSFNDSMDALTALRSVGMQDEVAARFFGQFTSRLRTATAQGKGAAKAFKDLGTSAEAVEKGMKTDAVGTMIDFLERLGKSKDGVKIALGVGGKEWFDEILRAKDALGEWKRLRGELTDDKVAGSLQKSIEIDSSTTEASLARLKQSALDFMAVWAKPAASSWGGLADGAAKVADSMREALENARLLSKVKAGESLTADEQTQADKDPATKFKIKAWQAPKGESLSAYERRLGIGEPIVVGAEQVRAALPYSGAMTARPPVPAPKKPWTPHRRRTGQKPHADAPTFVRDETPGVGEDMRQRAAPGARAPSVGGQLPAFASGSGVTPKVDLSQLDAIGPKAAAAKAALDALGISVTPGVDLSQLDSVAPKVGAAKASLEGLNVSVAPTVDASSVTAATATFVAAGGQMQQAMQFSAAPHVDAGQAVAALNSITAAANAARAAIGAANSAASSAASAAASKLPTMAQTNRGSYSAGGDPAGK